MVERFPIVSHEVADSDRSVEPENGASGPTAVINVLPPVRLTGQYEHRIDRKGRVVLPAAYRPSFVGGGYLQVWQNERLALLTMAGWEHWTAHVRSQILNGNAESARSAASVEKLMELVYRAAFRLVPDAQGRFIIPPRFRDWAPLDSEVHITGALDRIEIWLPEALADEDPAAAVFLDLIQNSYESHDR